MSAAAWFVLGFVTGCALLLLVGWCFREGVKAGKSGWDQ